MEQYIQPPTMGEVIWEEFMEPYNISIVRMAKDIRVPIERVQAMIDNQKSIDADMDARLCKYFGMSEQFFLKIQMDLAVTALNSDKALATDLEKIPCITKTLMTEN